MNIKKKEYNASPETDLVTALIVSDRFIQEIYPILNTKYLQSSYVKIVVKWCLEYYKHYKKAPGKMIQDIFNSKVREKAIHSENDAEMIETFLQNISDKFEAQESFNERFILDQSEKYLAERKLVALVEDIHANISSGKIDAAELAVAKHIKTERPAASSIDVLNDKESIALAFHEEEDFIFRFPGKLGDAVGNLNRGDFLSFLAPMKRGKTFWLMDVALRCTLRQLKVLFISLEMNRNAVLRRWYQNFLGETRMGEVKEIPIPYFPEDIEGDVTAEDILIKEIKKRGVTHHGVMKKIKQMKTLTRGGGLRLVCYPSNMASVETIKTEIGNLAHYQKFYPDVIVVDYADVLAPEPDSPKDYRHRIDHTWKTLRGLAQEINGLVVTASQSTRSTFSKDITEEDTAEDIRKLAHVTHMLSLNQNKAEKQKHAMRVGVLVSRNEEFHTDKNIMVLQQFGIGKAYIDSKFAKLSDKEK